MTGVFSKEHVHSLHRDELLEIVEAMEKRRQESLEQIVNQVGRNNDTATRLAGGVDLLDGFISEIRRELDRRNAVANIASMKGEVNDGPV